MPQFLRVDLRLDRWFVYPEIEWLPPNELQGDALGDLRTRGNQLSVFELDDPARLERIVVAVVAGRKDPVASEVGWVAFDGAALAAIGIRPDKHPEPTADREIDQFHHNLDNLTADRLVALAHVMRKGQMGNVLPKRLKELIRQELELGILDRGKLNAKFLATL